MPCRQVQWIIKTQKDLFDACCMEASIRVSRLPHGGERLSTSYRFRILVIILKPSPVCRTQNAIMRG